MVLKWKDEQAIIPEKYANSQEVAQGWDTSMITLQEAMKFSPRRFVEKHERFCIRNNPETYVKIIKKLSRIKSKPEWEIVFQAAKDLKLFDKEELINHITRKGITDGTLQLKVLSFMTCFGYVKRKMVTFTDNKGKEKFKYKFELQDNIIPCEYLLNDQCSFDWKNQSNETRFFS